MKNPYYAGLLSKKCEGEFLQVVVSKVRVDGRYYCIDYSPCPKHCQFQRTLALTLTDRVTKRGGGALPSLEEEYVYARDFVPPACSYRPNYTVKETGLVSDTPNDISTAIRKIWMQMIKVVNAVNERFQKKKEFKPDKYKFGFAMKELSNAKLVSKETFFPKAVLLCKRRLNMLCAHLFREAGLLSRPIKETSTHIAHCKAPYFEWVDDEWRRTVSLKFVGGRYKVVYTTKDDQQKKAAVYAFGVEGKAANTKKFLNWFNLRRDVGLITYTEPAADTSHPLAAAARTPAKKRGSSSSSSLPSSKRAKPMCAKPMWQWHKSKNYGQPGVWVNTKTRETRTVNPFGSAKV